MSGVKCPDGVMYVYIGFNVWNDSGADNYLVGQGGLDTATALGILHSRIEAIEMRKAVNLNYYSLTSFPTPHYLRKRPCKIIGEMMRITRDPPPLPFRLA
jgi:hypothetical protein